MTELASPSTPILAVRERSTSQFLSRIWGFIRKKPLAAGGALTLIVLIFVALAAPLVATHDPYSFAAPDRLQGPSAKHYFGTDEFGRDLFSRVIYGARVSLKVGFIAVLFSTIAGSVLGIASGYIGGWFDTIVQRAVDMLMAFPAVVLALAIVAARGQGVTNVIIALAVVQTPGLVRVVRSNVLALKERPFIEASKVIGASPSRIMTVHLLPNVAPSIIVLATAGLGGAILAEATLSFLGLGTPPPQPSWGGMLSGSARRFATQAPWLVIFPGIALSLAIYSFNLLGDGLRDVLDPRLRGR
jgi:peptide/nickel transport system permease protein